MFESVSRHAKYVLRIDAVGRTIASAVVCLFLEECLIEQDPSKYFYVAQGMLTIDNVDDAEEMKATDDAMDVLGFNKVCFARKIRLRSSRTDRWVLVIISG